MEKPFLYFENNLNSLLYTYEAAARHGAKAFIFSSSCTVYGEVKSSPVDENTPWQEASSVYGRTKQMGEQIIRDCAHISPMKAILLRYFNPAGAHISGLIGESPKNIAQNLVPVITETALGKRKVLKVFGNDYPTRDGTCVRDFIHVMDLARAHTLALNSIIDGRQQQAVETYNLGSGLGTTVMEAIAAFEKNTGIKLNYEVSPRRDGDISAIFSSYTKANKQLGWSPKYNIDDIMKSAWNFITSQSN